jgi:hypothetical protein
VTDEMNKRQFLTIGAGAAVGAGVGAGLGAWAAGAFFQPQPLGTNPSWGNDANDEMQPLNNPKSICLIFMRLRSAVAGGVAALDTALAWYRAADINIDHATFALNELARFRTSGSWGVAPAPVPRRTSTDFSRFHFGGKSLIFMYIDDQPRVSFDSVNRVQFTKFDAARIEMNKNKSFRNANVFPTTDQNALPGSYLYLENHFKKFRNESSEDGSLDIDNSAELPRQKYSMNIHLKLKSTNGVEIPLVVDPGTGNGGGWEP